MTTRTEFDGVWGTKKITVDALPRGLLPERITPRPLTGGPMKRGLEHQSNVLPWEVAALKPRVSALDPETQRDNSACLAQLMRPRTFEAQAGRVAAALKRLSEVSTRPYVRRSVTGRGGVRDPHPQLPPIPPNRKEEYAKEHPEEAAALARAEALDSPRYMAMLASAVLSVPVGYVLTRSLGNSLYLAFMAPLATSMMWHAYGRRRDGKGHFTLDRHRTDWWEREYVFTYDPSRDNRYEDDKPQGVGIAEKVLPGSGKQ